jgi:hypothetical protein
MNILQRAKIAVFVAIALFLVFAAPVVKWYRAGVQVEVWKREGIEMTQWEVFMGAKPLERNVRIVE